VRAHVKSFLALYPEAAYTAAEVVAGVRRRNMMYEGNCTELQVIAEWAIFEGVGMNAAGRQVPVVATSRRWWTSLLDAMVAEKEISAGLDKNVTYYHSVSDK
jgi:hypothetical protein